MHPCVCSVLHSHGAHVTPYSSAFRVQPRGTASASVPLAVAYPLVQCSDIVACHSSVPYACAVVVGHSGWAVLNLVALSKCCDRHLLQDLVW